MKRATAELALAIIATEAGRPERCISLTLRSECELVLTDGALHPVRWDLRLARVIALQRLGRADESVKLARDTLTLFETSGLPTGLNRPMLLEVLEASRGDDDYEPGWLIARAGGTLSLFTAADAGRWLLAQKAIFSELLKRGQAPLAIEHVAGSIRALPLDLLGDPYWMLLTRLIGGVSQACGETEFEHEAHMELVGAFNELEMEYCRVLDYEDEALLLLPRARVRQK